MRDQEKVDQICLDAAAHVLKVAEETALVTNVVLILTYDLGDEHPKIYSNYTGRSLETVGMLELVRSQILKDLMDEENDEDV